MAEAPRILLEHHLKRLKLPTFLRECGRARQDHAEAGRYAVADAGLRAWS